MNEMGYRMVDMIKTPLKKITRALRCQTDVITKVVFMLYEYFARKGSQERKHTIKQCFLDFPPYNNHPRHLLKL